MVFSNHLLPQAGIPLTRYAWHIQARDRLGITGLWSRDRLMTPSVGALSMPRQAPPSALSIPTERRPRGPLFLTHLHGVPGL